MKKFIKNFGYHSCWKSERICEKNKNVKFVRILLNFKENMRKFQERLGENILKKIWENIRNYVDIFRKI